MPNLSEIIRSIDGYRKVGRRSNPIGELTWVLKRTVEEDLTQAKEAGNNTDVLGLFAQSMLYAQRMLEIGYIFTEVFIRDEYKNWQPVSNSPRIIDLGGDPGAMSALYWKYRAPEAQVTVVEANPSTANVMKQNLIRRGLQDVQIVNAAVAENAEGNATLHIHKPRKGYHTQDYIGQRQENGISDEYMISVPKVKLSSLIEDDERIDLLKVDVEGSEGEVMRELSQSGKISQVDQIIMEFHHDPFSFPGNSLTEMLNILQVAGFVIKEAHTTAAKGLRKKSDLPLSQIRDIAAMNQKIFLTFSAANKK